MSDFVDTVMNPPVKRTVGYVCLPWFSVSEDCVQLFLRAASCCLGYLEGIVFRKFEMRCFVHMELCVCTYYLCMCVCVYVCVYVGMYV